MSELYDKYKISLKAADVLYKYGNLDNTVCHAAYYACLQLMKDTLVMTGVSLDAQEDEINADYNGRSHVYCISKTKEMLGSKLDTVRGGQDLYNQVKQLKIKRVKADYKPQAISKIESKWCLDKAKEITQLILSVR